MSWINREDLLEWLDEEADLMQRGIPDHPEIAYMVRCVRKHVQETPGIMDVYQAMQEIKRHCCDERHNCTDCPIRGRVLCDGIFPLGHRITKAKPEHEEER